MEEADKLKTFEQTVLPHLDAAHNLARWLTGNDHDAQDVTQDACVRAFRYFGGFRGGDARAWLLTIVRNTCHTWLRQNRPHSPPAEDPSDAILAVEDTAPNPGAALLQNASVATVREAIAELPVEFREAIVLRELEGLSYKEISAVADVPIGTVMSRLARARSLLQRRLLAQTSLKDHP